MPFVCHAPVADGDALIERGAVLSDADGARLSAEHPGAFTRVPPDPDLLAEPDPAPAPAKPVLAVVPAARPDAGVSA